MLRVVDLVWSISGNHPSAPAGFADRLVIFERVDRAFGGRKHFDAEPVEKRARPKRGLLERSGNAIIIESSSLARQANIEPKDFAEDPVEPHAGRRALEQVVVLGEEAPDRSRIAFRGPTVDAWDSEQLEPNALAVEHAEEIMVGDEQQLGGIRKTLIQREPCGISVAVRTEDRQRPNVLIKLAGDLPGRNVGREQPVGMKDARAAHQLNIVPSCRRFTG